MSTLTKLGSVFICALLFVSQTTLAKPPLNNGNFGIKASAPAGYDAYLTYIANGEIDPSDPGSEVTNCANGNCVDDYFLRVVQGRSESEILALEEDVKEFFLWRFGIDVDDPALLGRIAMFRFTLDPRAAYRAYAISGKVVPNTGYEVRDGGWILAFLDPNGVPLGGKAEGLVAPAGAVALVGEYNIAVIRGKRVVEEIDISYRSGGLVIANLEGVVNFNCQLHEGRLEDNGLPFEHTVPTGLAQGTSTVAPLENGLIKINTRNALTFSELGGL